MKKEFYLNQCDIIAREILDEVQKRFNGTNSATVLALSGDLGAGKTTLTKSVAMILGISKVITSPTFVIANLYDIPETTRFRWKKLIHMDAYRIENEEQLAPLHYDRWLNDSDNLIVIEWPELIQKAIPKYALTVSLKHKSEDIRSIEW